MFKLFENKKTKNVLFLCYLNQHRSLTAEHLYRNDRRFRVKSAGISSLAKRTLDIELLNWADLIVIMESYQKEKIEQRFNLTDKITINLQIEDKYIFMDDVLSRLISTRFEKAFTEITS